MLKECGMPIYEYECQQCGLFEVVQKASDKALKCKPDCQDPKCPKNAKRLISAAAFHLKGSGWYKTDYASKSPVEPKKSTSKASEKTGTAGAEASPAKNSKDKADGGSKT